MFCESRMLHPAFGVMSREELVFFPGNSHTGESRELQVLSSLPNLSEAISLYSGTSTKSAFFAQLDSLRRRERLRARHSDCSRGDSHVFAEPCMRGFLIQSRKPRHEIGEWLDFFWRSIRGTVSARSVFATANIAAEKNGTLRTTRRFAPS